MPDLGAAHLASGEAPPAGLHFGVLQGPNLNRLGRRPIDKYGSHELGAIQAALDERAGELGHRLSHVQSNSEGTLIDWLHERQDGLDGLIINPAGLTNYAESLLDAISDTGLPTAVVHISRQSRRDHKRDIFSGIATIYIAGAGWRGYLYSLDALSALFGAPDKKEPHT